MSDEAAASQVRESSTAMSTTEHSSDAESGLHYVEIVPPPPLQPAHPAATSHSAQVVSRLMYRLFIYRLGDFYGMDIVSVTQVFSNRAIFWLGHKVILFC